MSAVADGHGLSEGARGSTFYMAMRVLPREQREAILAVYGFCRLIDDIADEPAMERGERLARLESWRQALAALYAGRQAGPLDELAGPVARFGLRREDFEAVIDGMAMDATGEWRAPDWQALELYCDRVASAVGRLSVRIFGLEDARGRPLAHHLGRALQLTNILRDLDEDAAMGRLYLPREALEQVGISGREPGEVLAHPNLTLACTGVAMRALGHFREAEAVMRASPRRAVKAPRLMASAYRSILDRLIAIGWAPPRPHVGTDRLKLAGALVRYGLL